MRSKPTVDLRPSEQSGTCLRSGHRNKWLLLQHTHTPAGPGYGSHSGLKVKGECRDEWESQGEGRGGEGKRETGRSLLIHMPDITVTLLIQWDKHRRGVRGRTKTKTREKRGGAGVSWMTETKHSHGVPTFSLVLKFFQKFQGLKSSFI